MTNLEMPDEELRFGVFFAFPSVAGIVAPPAVGVVLER